MNEFSSLIQTLRWEIEAGLADPSAQPKEASLQAETVTLNLSVVLDPAGAETGAPGGARWRPVRCGEEHQAAHQVTLQFRWTTPASRMVTAPVLADREIPYAPPVTPRELIAARCIPIFGTPGFDNSARAEVFCELIAERDPAEIASALAAVSENADVTGDDPQAYLTTRLRRVLGFAFVGKESAATEMQRLLTEYSQADVLNVLAERWRFGTHWARPEPV